ncbi:alanine--tRNA ligase [Luteolibacter sp. Populi]|uniref:alanine--tRNA ligase n=1 Tax=Luteolibacter sp. Populi TaxID=3230487 RepID=UPI003466677C
MTAAEIRQSFLDFFREKQHTIVPSASLLPQSPGLLFTNAGMNPFVPYFLGVEKAPYDPPRAADTQKCIRAGGKHNDLEDVGYDTYHHTFFEMLGNWSFGNYFKKEAITWAWELVVERWGLPAHRLYASVYNPKPGDPGEFDQEAYDIWAGLFLSKGCDPKDQIVNGNRKDNFWQMGDTGPCGPCSELHVDLTPEGNPKTGRNLVNNDSDLCIEIWNLVFIQYNAEADGTFRELPSKHVDTGMGFERACSIIQGTKGFTDFSQKPSNYATDVFQPIFRKLEELSGQTYVNIYPELGADRTCFSEEMKTAIAFRVIADHLRTLSFSIADGIMPGNNGRNYVLRRILRRAVKYGRQLGFSGDKPFFGALVETLVAEMGGVFPELKNREDTVRKTLEQEEASFNATLDRGLKRFEDAVAPTAPDKTNATAKTLFGTFPGWIAFELEDTYGFPVDLTELLCVERGLALDKEEYETSKREQQDRSRAAQKTTIVRALDISSEVLTEFVGFDSDAADATVLEVHPRENSIFIITDATPFYAEMGGQTGDTGSLVFDGEEFPVTNVQQIGKARAHVIPASEIEHLPYSITPGDKVTLKLDTTRRRPVEAHHTATHLLHWALHEVVSKDAAQQGSSVDENRLRFDFNSGAVTAEQIAEMEEKVNACITENDAVSWKEVPHASIKGRPDIMQFFGDKYGELVRVVQIGGGRGDLTGYSMELCGGTHVRNTAEIGLFKIKSEGAIASGVRRIEAVCGASTLAFLKESAEQIEAETRAAEAKLHTANEKLAAIGEAGVPGADAPLPDVESYYAAGDVRAINDAFKAARVALESTKEAAIESEKRFKKLQAGAAAKQADAALTELIAAGGPIVASFEADASLLQELLNGMKKQGFTGAGFVIVDDGEKLHLGAYCGDAAQAAGHKAGDILRDLAAIAGGKGGGKPDQARGAAPERGRIEEVLAGARGRLG